jgi:biotin-[acetyl-CoA-carboxylase] ligase BirA-like protein
MENNHQTAALMEAKKILEKLHEATEISISVIAVGKYRLTVITFDEVTSTMNISAEWPSELLTDTDIYAFRAKQQTKGQAQASNNVWLSPPGNIYVTALLKLSESDLIGLTQINSLAVCQLLENHGIKDVHLKWINDVVVDGKKISGNLVRTNNLPEENYAVQIGIGVNVMVAPIEGSTCMQSIVPADYNVEKLNEELLTILIKDIEKSTNEGVAVFYQEVEKRILYLNEHVFIYDLGLTNIVNEGTFKSLGKEFEANLDTASGPVTVLSGRMRNKKL